MMRACHIDDINISDRQRKVFRPQPIDDLANSIAAKGLMHPVVLTEENGQLVLVAGERRLRAMEKLHVEDRPFHCDGQLMPPMDIPYVLLGELSEIERKEAELEENILREDLTWQERNDAIAELHRLRGTQNPLQTRTDTAREIAEKTDISRTTAERNVHQALLLDAFRDDPEVSRAKSQSEAFKIASRKLEQEFIAATERPRVDRGTYGCIKGDCREVLPTLKPGMFSAILVDPPYGMGAHEFGDAAQGIHHYDDTSDEAILIANAIFEHGMRITTETAQLFMFCDIDLFQELREMSKAAGWLPWRTPLVWSKGSMGHAPDPNHGPKRTYELIFFARKGDHRIKSAFSDVVTIPPDREKYHAAQKPVELYRYLLGWGTLPGQHVLDPCCGSGTIFPAAKELGVKALGVEKDPKFYDLCQGIIGGLR